MAIEQEIKLALPSTGIAAAINCLDRLAGTPGQEIALENTYFDTPACTLAQIKSAVLTSRKQNLIGRHLDFMIRSSQAASRRVRTETELCRNVTSVGSLAVRDAETATGGLVNKTVVIIGAGKIGDLFLAEIPREPRRPQQHQRHARRQRARKLPHLRRELLRVQQPVNLRQSNPQTHDHRQC